jgi:hypothetical protein
VLIFKKLTVLDFFYGRIDKKILALLQSNSQISNQELAEKVALWPSPCLRRVKQLEEHGKIIEHWRQSDDLGMMKQLGKI